MAHKAFIIHGHDTDALEQLVKFIKCLGLEHIPFKRVANKSASPFIADVVIAGINEADVVLALFTPDEQASLYGPNGEYHGRNKDGSRWQARPNVLFEAGVAYGTKREKTILLTMGVDVQLFSDASGIHFLNLAHDDSKEQLRERIEGIIGNLTVPPKWKLPTKSGNFKRCIRNRWKHYDELSEMMDQLKKSSSHKDGQSALSLLVNTVAKYPEENWHKTKLWDFMEMVQATSARGTANKAYWKFYDAGLIRFEDVHAEQWYEGEGSTWMQCAPHGELTERGRQLLMRLAIRKA